MESFLTPRFVLLEVELHFIIKGSLCLENSSSLLLLYILNNRILSFDPVSLLPVWLSRSYSWHILWFCFNFIYCHVSFIFHHTAHSLKQLTNIKYPKGSDDLKRGRAEISLNFLHPTPDEFLAFYNNHTIRPYTKISRKYWVGWYVKRIDAVEKLSKSMKCTQW